MKQFCLFPTILFLLFSSIVTVKIKDVVSSSSSSIANAFADRWSRANTLINNIGQANNLQSVLWNKQNLGALKLNLY